METIHIKCKVDEGAYLPEKVYDADAGFDLRTPWVAYVPAGGSALIDTGVHFDIPVGYCGFIKTKSGLNVKHSLRSAAGVIDSGYTGPVKVNIFNDSLDDYEFEPGDKVAQIVFLPIPYVYLDPVSEFDTPSARGDNGFGSSGK